MKRNRSIKCVVLSLVLLMAMSAFAVAQPDTSRLIEQPVYENEYTFIVSEDGYTKAPKSVEYAWYPLQKENLTENKFASTYITEKYYDEIDAQGRISISTDKLTQIADDPEEYNAIFEMYLPEGSRMSLSAFIEGAQECELYLIGDDSCNVINMNEAGKLEGDFCACESGMYKLAASAKLSEGAFGKLVIESCIAYIPQTATPLAGQNTNKLNKNGLDEGYYACKASFMNNGEEEASLVSEAAYVEPENLMGSIFAGSTAILVCCTLLIVAAVVAVIAIKKKTVKY